MLNKLIEKYNKRIIRKALEFGYSKGIITLKKCLILWYEINNKKLNFCPLCNSFLGKRRNIDHIIPKSKGGNYNLNNLQFTHRLCNRKKGNK